MLKKDWSIACDDTKFKVYKETLKALGYVIYEALEHEGSMGSCRHLGRSVLDGEVIRTNEDTYNFKNIEDFLLWHFDPSEKDLQIEEL